MKFCVHNGTLVSDKFDKLSEAIAHAEETGARLVFFIAGNELTEIRREGTKWELDTYQYTLDAVLPALTFPHLHAHKG